MSTTLVAGVGNIFLSDDGFGVSVIQRIRQSGRAVPEGVTIADFGISGVHLAYELLEGYDRLILVDAIARGEAPGTVFVLEPVQIPASGAVADAHGMEPAAVFAYLASIGGDPVPTLIVGCEPASLDEDIGLTSIVEAAIDPAIDVIFDLIYDPDRLASMASAAPY